MWTLPSNTQPLLPFWPSAFHRNEFSRTGWSSYSKCSLLRRNRLEGDSCSVLFADTLLGCDYRASNKNISVGTSHLRKLLPHSLFDGSTPEIISNQLGFITLPEACWTKAGSRIKLGILILHLVPQKRRHVSVTHYVWMFLPRSFYSALKYHKINTETSSYMNYLWKETKNKPSFKFILHLTAIS